jgi:hypothetical protein
LRPPLRPPLERFQSNGEVIALDSNTGWVPGLVGGGSDPNNGGSITDVPTARDSDGTDDYLDQIHDFLRDQQEVHRAAIAAIDNYFQTIKAKPNPRGSTESPRKIDDNTASITAGPRPDRFTVKPQQMLAYLQRDREKTEEDLAIQRQINIERKRALQAGMELAEAKKETLFSGSKS